MELAAACHPTVPAWFGRHFKKNGWAPTPLLAFLTETGMLKSLKVREAIVALRAQTAVWLPEDRDLACAVIGKFTQGSKAGWRRLTRRLMTDSGELDFLVRDTRQSDALVWAQMKCALGHVLTYYDGSQPLYAHLRASTLAYAHINLLAMLRSFWPSEAVRFATDSLYVQKAALHRLGVGAFVARRPCGCGDELCFSCLLEEPFLPPVAPAQWRDKGGPPRDPTATAGDGGRPVTPRPPRRRHLA